MYLYFGSIYSLALFLWVFLILLILYFVVTYRYNLRLEAMLQKEEFQITLETIEPTIEALQGAIEGVYIV